MLIKKVTTSSLVIATALVGSQVWAQQAPAPAEAAPAPAQAAPAEPVTAAPAPAQPAPAQPGTTDVPASAPLTEPAAPATAQAPADPAAPATAQAPADPAAPATATATAEPAPAAPAAQPAPQSAQAPADPAPAPGAPAPAEQAAAQPTPAQPAAAATQVASFVDQQFPALDTDGDGMLSQAEFEGWIGKLKSAELQSSGKPINDAEVKTYAQNAFLTADKDADKKVTKAEVNQFFGQA